MTDQLFIGQQELDFVSDINKEIISKWTGQEIIYYAIDMTATTVHDVYGESLQKIYKDPINIECLVFYDEPEVKSTDLQTEIHYSISVYFHKRSLAENNFFPQEGDYLKWGPVFYEIVTGSEPQLQFGRIENPMMIKCHCRFLRLDETGLKPTENVQELY